MDKIEKLMITATISGAAMSIGGILNKSGNPDLGLAVAGAGLLGGAVSVIRAISDDCDLLSGFCMAGMYATAGAVIGCGLYGIGYSAMNHTSTFAGVVAGGVALTVAPKICSGIKFMFKSGAKMKVDKLEQTKKQPLKLTKEETARILVRRDVTNTKV